MAWGSDREHVCIFQVEIKIIAYSSRSYLTARWATKDIRMTSLVRRMTAGFIGIASWYRSKNVDICSKQRICFHCEGQRLRLMLRKRLGTCLLVLLEEREHLQQSIPCVFVVGVKVEGHGYGPSASPPTMPTTNNTGHWRGCMSNTTSGEFSLCIRASG